MAKKKKRRANTISAFELMQKFPSEKEAREHLEKIRWPDGPVCPHCHEHGNNSPVKGREGQYRCRSCRSFFTVRIGTIFERSHIPLHKWIYALYQLQTARKGISAMQLSKEIGVSYKSAWFMLHRIREACDIRGVSLSGAVEVDETFIGGKEKNKHASKKLRAGRGAVGKQPVVGMRERGGKVIASPAGGTDTETLQGMVEDNIAPGSAVYTDEHRAYSKLKERGYDHHSVNHSVKEFVNGMAHTNGVESVWAIIKRGYHGTYHHWSFKHMKRYIDEYVFRLNEGSVERDTLDRINDLCRSACGKRLTWDDLVEEGHA